MEMITEPYTDLWQRTYYHFRNDNAPVLQMETDKEYFSFVVKTEFDTKVSVSMLVAQRIPRLRQYLQIWKSLSANGLLTMDKHPMKNCSNE